MNNFIPLYRAEVQDHKLNLDNIEQFTELIDGKRYAIGLLSGKGRHIEVTKGDTTTFLIIDESTSAIHFPDMLDSQGNKIFASLSEDGKGGDIVQYKDTEGIAYFDCFSFQIRANTNQGFLVAHNFSKSKVIGIQK